MNPIQAKSPSRPHATADMMPCMDAVHLPPRNMVEASLLTLVVIGLPFAVGCIWLATKWINNRGNPRQLVTVSAITLVTCAGIVGTVLVLWGITASCGI